LASQIGPQEQGRFPHIADFAPASWLPTIDKLVEFLPGGVQMASWKKLFPALAVIFALALPSLAQTDRAILEGTVTDPSGGTVAGARVKISAVETGITQERSTNPNGQYRFPGIAIGEYTVSVSNSGFKTKSIEDVILLGCYSLLARESPLPLRLASTSLWVL
jgi:hypothetical protein